MVSTNLNQLEYGNILQKKYHIWISASSFLETVFPFFSKHMYLEICIVDNVTTQNMTPNDPQRVDG